MNVEPSPKVLTGEEETPSSWGSHCWASEYAVGKKKSVGMWVLFYLPVGVVRSLLSADSLYFQGFLHESPIFVVCQAKVYKCIMQKMWGKHAANISEWF